MPEREQGGRVVTVKVVEKPERFDRVDRVKAAVGQEILPEDDIFWILGDPMVLDIDGERHEIPVGFTTDGASVPHWAARITRWHRWDEPQRWAGITHDWLYTQAGIAKRFADRAFRGVLAAEGASRLREVVMYLAVVVGGGPAYRANQSRGPRIYR